MHTCSGSGADSSSSGDHAGVKWINGSCLACDFCQQSDEPLCSKALLSGYTVDGSFQQYAIAKAAHVARLHKDIPLDGVAPVLCGKLGSRNEKSVAYSYYHQPVSYTHLTLPTKRIV